MKLTYTSMSTSNW